MPSLPVGRPEAQWRRTRLDRLHGMSDDDALSLTDLPAEVVSVVEPIVRNASTLLVTHPDDPFSPDTEQYVLSIIVGRQYVRLMFDRPKAGGTFRESSQSIAFDDIKGVRVDSNGGRIEVGEGEERYATGVPVEIAHAIMAAG